MQQLLNQALSEIKRTAYVLNRQITAVTKTIVTGDISYLTQPINVPLKKQAQFGGSQAFGSQSGLFGASLSGASPQNLWGGSAGGISGGRKRKRGRNRNKTGGQQVFGGFGGNGQVGVPQHIDQVAQKTAQYLAQMMRNGQVQNPQVTT